MSNSVDNVPLVGVLALQGAFEEHQECLEAVGCKTVQVRVASWFVVLFLELLTNTLTLYPLNHIISLIRSELHNN